MIQLGLIGYPLEHSLSPKIHAAALKECGLEGNYSLFPIHRDDQAGLKNLLNRVRSGEITGLNVTIPHKQNVISLLDELTPTAKDIGAVNTIYLQDNKIVGDNTDAAGFLADLNRFINGHRPKIENRKSALILGAGGAARAVIYALLHDGWHVAVAARHIEQALQLADSFAPHELYVMNYEAFVSQSLTFDLAVNATPVGMMPHIDQSPWPDGSEFPRQAMIYDLVYSPRETKLVKDACAAGLSATTGLVMLIEQAALAFEIWTGYNPPRNILFESINH